ncbi:hypothetical protein THRCLA_07770 [Thraustotheca clavata]|uniref:FYVE-type domain-containing protein n=1 Tax=Thraustotheca clavata TaxID=74557 RepID=A0A1V9ZC17_9STRA|nr:hypothetical protein THRCLA_07770 [Thraustotheca clavata]
MPLKYSDVLDIVGQTAHDFAAVADEYQLASRTKWPWTFRDYHVDMPIELIARRGASLVHHITQECKTRNAVEHIGSLDEKVFTAKDAARNLFTVNAMVEMSGSIPEILDVLVGKSGAEYSSFLARIFRGHLTSTRTIRSMLVNPEGYVVEADTGYDGTDEADETHFNHIAAIASAELAESHFFKKVSKELVYMDFMHINPNERAVTRVFKSIDNEMGPIGTTNKERYKHILFGYHIERLGRGDRLRISFYGDYCINKKQKQSWKDTRHLLEKLGSSVHLLKRICERQTIDTATPPWSASSSDTKKWCHVCHNTFTLFRKRTLCKYCSLPVCSDCYQFEEVKTSGGAVFEVCICRLCKASNQHLNRRDRISMASSSLLSTASFQPRMSGNYENGRVSSRRTSSHRQSNQYYDEEENNNKPVQPPLSIVAETDGCNICHQPTAVSTHCRLCRQICCSRCCRLQQYTNRHGIAFEAWLCLQCLATTSNVVTTTDSRQSTYEPKQTNFTPSDFIDTTYVAKSLARSTDSNGHKTSSAGAVIEGSMENHNSSYNGADNNSAYPPPPNASKPTYQPANSNSVYPPPPSRTSFHEEANNRRSINRSHRVSQRENEQSYRLSDQSELRSSFSVEDSAFDGGNNNAPHFPMPMHQEGSVSDNASVMNAMLHRDEDEQQQQPSATSPIVLDGVPFHTDTLISLPKPKTPAKIPVAPVKTPPQPLKRDQTKVISLGAVSNARLLLGKESRLASSVGSNENAVPSIRSTTPSIVPSSTQRENRSTVTNDAQDAIEAETLRMVAFLDMASNDALDDICHRIACKMDCAYGFVVLIYKGDFVLKGAATGNRADCDAPTQIPRDCILSSQSCQVPLMLPDAEMDPRFATSLRVTGEERVRFYYGLPLVSHSGVLLGTVAVADTHARVRISSKQHQAMIWFAESTAALIVNRVQAM